jgi:D-arabinose 1-dehydrogenase-like Zn-dependent alcohol dehydrogenase
MTMTTYRAVQVSKPGRLEVVERELTAPPPGKVRIGVEACGVLRRECVSALNRVLSVLEFSFSTRR